MTDAVDALRARIAALEADLEAALSEERSKLLFRLENGRAIFDAEVTRRQAELRTSLRSYLDAALMVYQAICFRAYGIDRVNRSDHIILDRHRLHYLNGLQKLNCLYCSYANGLLALAVEIAARTEAYWCPIKHSQRPPAAHRLYRDFAEYGDAEAFSRLTEAQKDRSSDAS
jgi:hypothetical protein